MTSKLEQEKESIEKAYDALWERVDKVCRSVVERICKKTGWRFSSAYNTMFTSKGTRENHDFYLGGGYVIEHDFPQDFQEIFDWAEGTKFGFPDMIYDNGWVA